MSVTPTAGRPTELDPDSAAFYRHVLESLIDAGVPVLVGGAYAFAIYTGIERHTKDLDLFVRRADFDRVEQALNAAGYQTELTFPHWLGKAYGGSFFVDLIFASGNGLAPVDDHWFSEAVEAEVLGVRAKIMPAEEIICSKAFIMERERYDGADVAHLFNACGGQLDWDRLVGLFGPHWRVLLSHLVLFGFIYPGQRGQVPTRVLDDLVNRLREDMLAPPPSSSVCQGTLLSREQFLHDIEREGYTDGRLPPTGRMTSEQIETWTAAIPERSKGEG